MRNKYLVFVALILLCACKKEIKPIIPTCQLEVVNSKIVTAENGRYNTEPIVVKIMQAGKQLPLSKTNYVFEVESNNCDLNILGSQKPAVNLTVNNDGTINLFWYTGEKTGEQTIKIWLVDNDSKQRITSVQTKVNIIANTDGFVPSCFNSPGSIMHIENDNYLFFGYSIYGTNNSGGNWQTIGNSSPNSSNNIRVPKVNKPFNYYHKQSGTLFYTRGYNIFKSTDQGQSWTDIVEIHGYIGQLSSNEFLMSYKFGILKLTIHDNGETEYSHWSYVLGATGMVTDQSKFYIYTFDGVLYSSTSISDTVLVNQNSSIACQHMYKEGNTIYAFSAGNIYTFSNGVFSPLGSLTLPAYQQVCDVVKQNNNYYVFTMINSNYTSTNLTLYCGTNLTQLNKSNFELSEPNLGLERNWSCENNYLCITNKSGFVSFKRP